ncbi:MFS transporter [Chloroflexus aggregans]|uniref:Major facilitator superfamily MFS_1 n=1 Tax=Chloroflexus aggregans (strain MD-66 / DSM 9485) TaxID=326427 RepID=B8GBN7_CHLAD|nr:MFS transporter [Chloroflexus aggregans]ACL24854.1 major facilitator superfamily MFS_1 [Chloroflexus aggregans DSM 9485]
MKRTWALIIVGLLYFGVGWILSAIGPSLPGLAVQVNRDVTELGAVFTAFSLGAVLASVGVGAAIGRWGMRTVIAGGAALMGGGILWAGFSPTLLGLLAGTLIGGFGYGGMLAGGNLLIARLYQGAAGALNALNLFFSVGSIGGPLLVAAMIGLFGQPQAAIWLAAIVMLVLVAPALRLGEPTQAPTAQMSGAPRWLAAVMFGLIMFTYIGTEIGIGGWIALILERGAGLAAPQAALGTSLFWGMLTGGRLAATFWGDRLGPLKLLLLCLVGLGLSGALLVIGTTQFGLALTAVALMGLACGPIFPTTMLMITHAAGRSGVALSVALTIGTGGGLFLPALFGFFIGWFGPAMGSLLVVVDAILMVVMLAVAYRGMTRSAQLAGMSAQ